MIVAKNQNVKLSCEWVHVWLSHCNIHKTENMWLHKLIKVLFLARKNKYLWPPFKSGCVSIQWPVCRLWFFNWPDCINRAGHTPQAYGLAPVCRRMWSAKSFDWVNARAHMLQTYGRSPVWTRLWRNCRNFEKNMNGVW